MDGVIAGAAGNLLNLGSPIGNAAVMYGVGRWRRNATLETIAGIQAGRALLAPGALGGLLGGITGGVTGSTPTTGQGLML